jgi:phage terminase large subunit GpA-like protein
MPGAHSLTTKTITDRNMKGSLKTSTILSSVSALSNVASILVDLADIFLPPERMTIADASAKYVFLNNPGQHIGLYDNDRTPYMREPMNMMASRDKSSVVFVGSAQSGKTQGLIVNWVGYNACVDPMDMIIYCPTQAAARDFSTRRIDRLHRYSSEIGSKLVQRKDADNKFDKLYRSGAILTLSWPSVTELAGRPIGRVALTDYDRMPDDVEGDGSPYDLAAKRTTTYGSFAMTVAESSPSRPIKDPKWIRTSAHEAPPCEGILALYNRGDRRRWYWPCPECGEFFEGTFRHLVWDDHSNIVEASDTARMVCPFCDAKIHPDSRREMNLKGMWLADGQSFDIVTGEVVGDAPRAEIASYWLNGVAATFISWRGIVRTYLDADKDYQRTGSEESLKKFYNNDLSEPYLPKSMESERLPEHLKARAEPLGGSKEEPIVPKGVRFLVATVDVQKNSFVVQVHGISPGEPHDVTIVDRFDIRKSDRLDEDDERYMVRPGTYLADWDKITEQVIDRSYPVGDESGRRMGVKLTLCDSGGKEGVTTNAYQFVRRLRELGKAGRFHLVKGDSSPTAPRARISYPDSNRRDTKAAAQGDVPVLMFNPTMLKDTLSNRLDCLVPGKGLIRFPDWLSDYWYAEVCAERRTEKGWENPSHTRNEAWDLLYYCIGGCISPLIRIETWDWSNPPNWATAWEEGGYNSLVFEPDQTGAFATQDGGGYDFSRFAKTLA